MIPDPVHPDAHMNGGPSRFFKPLMLLALLVGGVFAGLAFQAGVDGHAAPFRRDAYLFHQYARAMAEGHPYRFNAADAPSTGATSHLYAVIMAIFYLAGARGAALSTAALFFNLVCWIGFIAFFHRVARRLVPALAGAAPLLCILSGQAVITALDESEMALFMLIVMAAWDASLARRSGRLAAFLFLASWCRPEGVILSLVMVAVGGFSPPQANADPSLAMISERRRWLIAGVIGVAGYVLVMALNHSLTGAAAFHSVLGKGLTRTYPFFGYLHETADALGRMMAEILMGLRGESESGRDFYFLPVAGGSLMILGLASRDWKKAETARFEIWFLVSAAASVLLVAQSGWAGSLNDRHLAWILPAGFIYLCLGIEALAEKLGGARLRKTLIGLMAIYGLIGLFYFAPVYAGGCARVAESARFARKVDAMLPEGAKLGMMGGTGLVYMMPHRDVVSVEGIVSPDFTHDDPVVMNAELLKHRVEERFGYWLLHAQFSAGQWFSPFVGAQLAAQTPALGGANALVLHRAEWGTVDGSTNPLSPEALRAVEDLHRADMLDIGYREDEIRCGYSVFDRVSGTKFQPGIATLKLAGRNVTEVGRVVIGSETFRVRAEPGKPMRVVMRTSRKLSPRIYKPGEGIAEQDFEFGDEISILLFVDDRPAGRTQIKLGAADEFSEVVFDLAADAIRSSQIELTIGGDHIAFAYWFYQ